MIKLIITNLNEERPEVLSALGSFFKNIAALNIITETSADEDFNWENTIPYTSHATAAAAENTSDHIENTETDTTTVKSENKVRPRGRPHKTKKHLTEGANLKPGKPIIEINDLDPVAVFGADVNPALSKVIPPTTELNPVPAPPIPPAPVLDFNIIMDRILSGIENNKITRTEVLQLFKDNGVARLPDLADMPEKYGIVSQALMSQFNI